MWYMCLQALLVKDMGNFAFESLETCLKGEIGYGVSQTSLQNKRRSGTDLLTHLRACVGTHPSGEGGRRQVMLRAPDIGTRRPLCCDHRGVLSSLVYITGLARRFPKSS